MGNKEHQWLATMEQQERLWTRLGESVERARSGRGSGCDEGKVDTGLGRVWQRMMLLICSGTACFAGFWPRAFLPRDHSSNVSDHADPPIATPLPKQDVSV